MDMLSVDWDYFFPEPIGAGIGDKYALYYWGFSESHSPSLMDYLWHSRASTFLSNGMELPQANDEWRTFWDRFDLTGVKHLFVANSHMYAGHDRVSSVVIDRFTKIVSFDAHHDLGYKDKVGWGKGGTYEVTCEDWLRFYVDVADAMATVVYPDWKVKAFDLESGFEADPTHVVRVFNRDFDEVIKPDVVFIARSGSWVPPWCDNKFNEFVSSFPHGLTPYVFDVDLDIPGWVREYDPDVTQKMREQFEAVMANVGK